MIRLVKNGNADSRTAKEDLAQFELEIATEKHQEDVRQGLLYFAEKLNDAGWSHDWTKAAYMEEFYQALKGGDIKGSKWYNMHVTKERHHLLTNAPDDVTMIDILEHITDCVMAGLARSGDIYDVDLPAELLQKAVRNTVELLKSQIEIVEVTDAE